MIRSALLFIHLATYFFAADGSLLCNTAECKSTTDHVSLTCSPFCFHQLCDFLLTDDGIDNCKSKCLETSCDEHKLGNSICDEECNSQICAYDYGDCTFCAVGCQADMLGNGVCDSACNVVACSFDMKDCELCSENCQLSQLGNGECDSACNNVNCDFDLGDCPLVQPCLFEMIGNGICNLQCLTADNNWDNEDCNCAPSCPYYLMSNGKCDQECNIPECLFDIYKCVSCKQYECAPGCPGEIWYDGICHEECNVPSCGYSPSCYCSKNCSPFPQPEGCVDECMALRCDFNRYGQEGGCSDEVKVRISLFYQLANRDFGEAFSSLSCWQSGCDFNEYLIKVSANECMLACNNRECAYAVGLCTTNLHERCLLGYGSSSGECFQCREPFVQYFGFCIEVCPRGYTAHHLFPSICVLDTVDMSSESSPDQFYMLYDLSMPIVTEGNRYRSLNDALAAAWMKYTVILLLGDSFIFNPYYAFSANNPDYLPRAGLPDLISDGRWKYLTIKSLLCENNLVSNCADKPITIYLKKMITIVLSNRQLTLENVVLSTSLYFQYQDVKYCPYLQSASVYHLNDRGSIVFGMQWSNMQCKSFIDFSLFVVKSNSVLSMRDVVFQDFTLQMKAIVELEGGDVVMTNVNFTNVQPSMSAGAVILESEACVSIEYCSNIYYRGGAVTLMNNGYEFRGDLKLNPFISAFMVTNLELIGVTVTFSTVSDAVNVHAFIMLDNFFSLAVINSQFSNNFFVGSLISISSSVILPTTKQDSQHRLISTIMPHITIKSSLFSQSFSLRSLIQIFISRDLLNIIIDDCKFEQIALAEGSLVEIEYKGIVGEKETVGLSSRGLWIAPRWLNVTAISFTEVSSFDTLLSFTNYANILISELNVSHCGERGELTPEAVMRFYISMPSVYASILPSYGADLGCSSLVSLKKVTNIEVANSSLTDNKCLKGGTGFETSETAGTTTVKNVFAARNSAGKISGVVLTVQSNVLIEVRNLTATANEHSDQGVIYMSSGSMMVIKDSWFEGNVGYSGACIKADGGSALQVWRSSFIKNSVLLGSGGAIYSILNSTSTSEFSIFRCDFISNQASLGGAIFLSFPLTGQPLNFSLSHSSFRGNNADLFGSSIYTTTLLQFQPDSSIFNCSFKDEVSDGGVLGLQHVAGTLNISQVRFEGNQGSLSAGLNIQTSATAMTILEKVVFVGSKLGPMIAKPNSRIYSRFRTIDCSFHGGNWPLIILENGNWEDFGSSISASQVTAVEATLTSRCILSSTYFIGNASPKSGGAVHLSSQSVLFCMSCNFWNNDSKENGGAIFAEQGSEIIVERCLFEGNSARESGAGIYLLSAAGNYSVISECDFRENVGGDNSVISCFSSTFRLLSSGIANLASSSTAGISVRLSTVVIFNCSLSAQASSPGSFLSVLTSSSVSLSDSTFIGGYSSLAGAISLVSSNLTITSSNFQSIEGRVFSVSSFSYLSLHSVSIRDITSSEIGYIIEASESTLDLSSCDISRYESGAIYGSGVSSMTISNTLISDGKGQHGSAVSCYKCRYVAIENCQIRMQSAEQGALFFDSDTIMGLVAISDTQIVDNRADSGAGVYLNNYHLAVTRSIFRNNTAVAGEGGAVFLDCLSSSLCNFVLTNNTFEANSALQAGGALRWKAVKPTLIDTIFRNNFASYGPDLASFAVKLNVSMPRQMTELTIAGVPPGQDSGIKFIASLLDHYGQVVSNDNASYAELRPSDLKNASVSGVSKVVSVDGIFTFSEFQIYSQPGKAVTLTISSPTVAINSVDSETDVQVKLEMRDCEKGETKTDVSCLVCGRGTYNFNESQPCQNCPNNAECMGRASVLPMAGYWKPENLSIAIIECPRKASCLGGHKGSEINLNGFCAEGYKSNLCQSCAPDYFRSGKNLCQKCPEFTVNLVESVFVVIAVLVALVVLVWSSMHSALKPKSVSSIYLKILLNYVQVLFLVSEIDLSWPNDAWSFLQFQRSAGGVSYYAFSPDCLLGGTENTSSVFYRKMIFLAILPLFIILAAGAFWALVAFWTHKHAYLQEQFLATLVIVFFFIHPTLVQAFFSMFSCKEVLSGEYWLTLDMATRCWDSEHLKYIGAVGIPAVLVWVIGVPTLILVVIVRYQNRLSELTFRKPFGFLITGYNPRHFYWEFMVLFRKIGIICISSFFSDTAATQALSALMILLVYSFWFFQAQPYTNKEMNRLEISAVIAADFTIYSGLFFLVGNLSEGGKLFFFLTIAIPNLTFYANWLFEMLRLTGISIFSSSSATASDLASEEYVSEFASLIAPPRFAVAAKFCPHDLHSMYREFVQRPLSCSIPQQYSSVLNYRTISHRGKNMLMRVAPSNISEIELLGQRQLLS